MSMLIEQKFPETVPRLMRSIPPWKDKLFEMFKECIIDWENMLATAASEPSEVDPISPTTTSGGRKRSSSAATQSTATKSIKEGKIWQGNPVNSRKSIEEVNMGEAGFHKEGQNESDIAFAEAH